MLEVSNWFEDITVIMKILLHYILWKYLENFKNKTQTLIPFVDYRIISLKFYLKDLSVFLK